ncbi:replication initiation protein [Brevibacillus sp. HB1.3]|uniref:replication initiation protein n=1 Tax=Brevibacillus sp. HB1.3 TaxID=2738842 RepID=UPI001C1323CB|nr:replication initiation protein [Brevibacillus sp. HB1.3]
MKAKVSIDKFVVEYKDVTFGAYFRLVIRAAISCELYKQTIYHGDGYSHELHLKKANGAYLHVFYRNIKEPEGSAYTLRLETRPEYYVQFKEVLDRLRSAASGIYYVSCDIAYDVKTSMDNVIVFPKDGRRKMRHYKGTRYFGDKHQRKTNGYCRNYNKGLELLENQSTVIDFELTRIEIVDKPERRIPLAELLHHPPEQNKHYFAAMVTDWDSLPKKRAEQTRRLRDGADIEEVTPYIRKKVKETLAHPYQIDFNELAREAWEPLLEELCGVLLGQQKPQVQERHVQMAVTNTVYDEPKEENDSKNDGCADFGKYRILRNNTGIRMRLNQQRMTGLFELRKMTSALWSRPSSRVQQKSSTFFVFPLKKSPPLIYVYCK